MSECSGAEECSSGWTRTVSEFNIGRIRDEAWERDRQVILSQLHNLLLALRSNVRFTTRPIGPQRSSASPIPLHPLTAGVRDLRERLFYPSATAGRDDFTAEELLEPFCNVIVSDETTEPITGVALASFVAFLDLKCSFLTAKALRLMSETARGSRSEIADTQSHEAVLARILQVYVGCARHPNAERMPEREIVAMLEGAYTVATYGEPSELLRRTAEQAMNDIVTTVFERVLTKVTSLHNSTHMGGGGGGPNTKGRVFSITSSSTHHGLVTPTSAVGPADEIHSFASKPSPQADSSTFMISDGHVILEYICSLISSPSTFAMASPSPSPTEAHYHVSAAAVQLQGLCLAHTVLFLLKDSLARAPNLLRCVRNTMCRALLRVGSSCTNVIVLSQLLRTSHLVVQFAAIDVVPQALSIIDQLHLEPLERLLAPLPSAGGGGGGAEGGSGSGGNGNGRHGSIPPMSPTSNASSPRSLSSNPPGTALGGNGGGGNNQYLIDSDFAGNEAHEMLMESFLEFCANPSFPSFCYAHYDLSLEYKDLLETVCRFTARCVSQSVIGATSGVLAMSLLGEDLSAQASVPYSLPSVRWSEVGVLALDGLTAMLRSIHQRVSHADYAASRRAADGQEIILEQLGKKKRLQDFAELFDKGEFKKAVAFILTPPEDGTAVTVCSPEGEVIRRVDCFGLGKGSSGWDLGEFLFRYKSVLDRTALGDFLGELGKEPLKPTTAEDPDGKLAAQWEEDRRDDYKVPMSVRFFQQVLKGFLNCFNCRGKSLIRSIREVMYQMKLPGESQKIDRVMETFANHWFSVNKDAGPEVNPFSSVDGAFILAFSIIMLNTDLHSGKMVKVMSKDEFKRMNRGIDDGNSLPDEYLSDIYDDVRANQIVMIDMIKQGYSNDSVWTLEIIEAKVRAAHDLPIGLRANSTSQLAALDPFVFNVMWRPSVAALLTVLTHVCAACDGMGTPLMTKNVTSLKSMWAVLKAESKKNYDIIRSALEGILRCAETASILGNTPALDFIVSSLAQHIIPPLQQWFKTRNPSAYGRAGKSALVLIFSHLLMKVVDRFGSDMVEGWSAFVEVWHLFYMCGVFSDEEGTSAIGHVDPSPTANDAKFASTSQASDGSVSIHTGKDVGDNGDGEEGGGVGRGGTIYKRRNNKRRLNGFAGLDAIRPTLRPILRGSPIRCAARSWGGLASESSTVAASAASVQANGGGWFSGLWGGNNQMLIDEQRREQALEDKAAMSRLRSSIPSLTEMFQMRFTPEGLARLISNLCFFGEVKHTLRTEGNTSILEVDPAKAFASSYLAQILVEVAIFNAKRVDFKSSNVFAFLRSIMSISFRMLQQAGGGFGMAADQQQGGSSVPIKLTSAMKEEMAFWKLVSDRVVDAVMALLDALSRSEATRESLFLLLTDLTALPEQVFKLVIAEPLGRLLANLLEPQLASADDVEEGDDDEDSDSDRAEGDDTTEERGGDGTRENNNNTTNTNNKENSTSSDGGISHRTHARHPLRSCTREGWTRLIGAARMVAVRSPSQGLRMLALRVLVLMAREASIGDWATLAHLQSIAMSIAEVLALDPIHRQSRAGNNTNNSTNATTSVGSLEEAFEVIHTSGGRGEGKEGASPMLGAGMASHLLSSGGGGSASFARYEVVADQAPEALVMLHKTIVSSRFMPNPSSSGVAAFSSSPSGVAGACTVEEWTGAWLTCIGALATLAASVPNDKIASDALLATQRCILDDRLLLLDAQQIMRLFHTVLLPMMETICNTSIALERSNYIINNTATATSLLTNNDPISNNGGPNTAVSQNNNDGGFKSFFLPSVLISAVFGPMAGPERKKATALSNNSNKETSVPSSNATATSSPPLAPVVVATIEGSSPTPSLSSTVAAADMSAASPTTVAVQSFRPPQKIAMARNDEVQCRCIGLIPKALLHFTDKLVTSPASMVGGADGTPQPLMTVLWREVIGTLYALYTGGCADSVLLEAIKENIRNVVHVLVALCPPKKDGAASASHHASTYNNTDKSLALARTNPQFWYVTKALLKPFPFSDGLVAHIDESVVV